MGMAAGHHPLSTRQRRGASCHLSISALWLLFVFSPSSLVSLQKLFFLPPTYLLLLVFVRMSTVVVGTPETGRRGS